MLISKLVSLGFTDDNKEWLTLKQKGKKMIKESKSDSVNESDEGSDENMSDAEDNMSDAEEEQDQDSDDGDDNNDGDVKSAPKSGKEMYKVITFSSEFYLHSSYSKKNNWFSSQTVKF